MKSIFGIGVVVVGLALLASPAIAGAAADQRPSLIDLSSFDEVQPQAETSAFDDLPVQGVASWQDTATRRFYVTGYLGSSFATLNDRLLQEAFDTAVNGTILTAGGAAGFAYQRDNGQLRLEFEGMGRDDLIATVGIGSGESASWGARDGWSTLFNVWRDVSMTDRLGVYAGGGIGAGGYRFGFGGRGDNGGTPIIYSGGSNVATFAWQAGGGLVYDVTERIAFDVGYRFFALEQGDTTLFATSDSTVYDTYADAHRFTASELLFGLRIYEPFRNWR